MSNPDITGQSTFQAFEVRARKSREEVQAITDVLYNRDADSAEYRMPPEDRAVWTDDLKDLITRHVHSLTITRRPRVLDVGTGTGAFAVLMAEFGFDVTGIDGAEKMVSLGERLLEGEDRLVAERVNLKRIEWARIQEYMEEASSPSGQFDAVVSRHVTAHLYAPIEDLARWATWLRPGGTLVIVDGLWRRAGWTDGFDDIVDDLPLSVVSGLGTISYLVEQTGQFRIRHRRLLNRVNRDSRCSRHVSGPRYVLVAQRIDAASRSDEHDGTLDVDIGETIT